MYSCKIIADSISEIGKRLTTMEIIFPRIVLAELNTHRMFSRNSASSRAIPFEKQIRRIEENPFIPEQFPINCRGMQPQEYITEVNKPKEYSVLVQDWLSIRNDITERAKRLQAIGDVHKQLVNRLLEPFMWHTVIVTATEWDNFFKLRTNEQAQWEIRRIADLMYEVYHAFDNINYKEESNDGTTISGISDNEWSACRPKELKVGEWHLPFVSQEDINIIHEDIIEEKDYSSKLKEELKMSWDCYEELRIEIQKRISVARCARVSYLTHDGKRDINKDLELFEKLKTSGHWSPFEHIATPHHQYMMDITGIEDEKKVSKINKELYPNRVISSGKMYREIRSGNFIGWKQFRKEFKDENCTNFRKESNDNLH